MGWAPRRLLVLQHLSMDIFKDAYEDDNFDDIFELLGDIGDDEERKRGGFTPGTPTNIERERRVVAPR